MKMKKDSKAMTAGGRPSDRNGSALIVALWVVILLSLVVGSFAFDMQIEARLTSYYRKRLKASHLARAGIERARMLLVQSLDPEIKQEEYEKKDAWWFGNARSLARGGPVYGVTDALETGSVSIDIVPEPARRNVNLLSVEDWRRVLETAGVPEELWDELIDCFFDWTDSDDQPRSRGAETEDYYGRLDVPIRAKNGPLYTTDEILLIKGFNTNSISGDLFKSADTNEWRISNLTDLLTVFGDGKVNVNAAPLNVLMTLPGMTQETAQEIELERSGYYEANPEEDYSFENVDELFSRVSNLSPDIRNCITVASGIYQITSVGSSQGVKRRIYCTASVERSGKMTILRWQESD